MTLERNRLFRASNWLKLKTIRQKIWQKNLDFQKKEYVMKLIYCLFLFCTKIISLDDLFLFFSFFEKIQSILEALARELQRDYRDDTDIKPVFKKGILKMSDLKTGTIVTGVIANITTFGCFVDIGVGRDGLIHNSQLRGFEPNIGDRVNVLVISVDENKKHIQLRLDNIL